MDNFHNSDSQPSQINQFDMAFYQVMIDTLYDGAFVVENKCFKLVNDAFCRLTGCSNNELIGRSFNDFIYPKNDSITYEDILDKPSVTPLNHSVVKQKMATNIPEYHLVVSNKSGSDTAVEMRSKHFIDHNGQLYQVTNLRKKFTEQALSQALRESENNLQRLIDQLPDVYFQTDSSGIITKASFHTTSILGYESGELIGKSLSDLYLKASEQAETLARVIGNKGQPVDIRTYLAGKDESRIKVSLRVYAKYNINREFIGVDAIAKDVATKESMLHGTIVRDPLTKLINQLAFNEHLSKSIRFARRHQKKLWVLYVSLQNLSDINDLFGKIVRDTCLVNFSQRLQGFFRDTDIVARVTDGDFVVLLDDYTRDFILNDLVEGLHDVMDKKTNINQYPYGFTFNIGHAAFPTDGLTGDELINHAESNMYKFKFSKNIKQDY